MENENEKYIEESDETIELKFRRFGNWLGKNLPTIFAILISVFFIFNGTVRIIPTQMSVKEQIIMAIINIFAGFSITSLISEHGFQSAKKTGEYRHEVKEYNDSVQKGLKWREGVENLAKKKANDNLRNYRNRLLEGVGLRYDEVFDSYDHIISDFDIRKFKDDKNYRKKVKAYHKAMNVKTYSPNVFGRASSNTFGLKKEVSEKSYRAKTSTIKAITKLILGIVSVGAMLEWLGFTIGAIIYAFMQVVLWCSMGLIDSQKNFNFIMNEIVPQYESNRLIIQEFLELPDRDKEKYMPSKFLQIEMKENPIE